MMHVGCAALTTKLPVPLHLPQFDVNWDHLEPALERFAQFFICPLISEDGVDREVSFSLLAAACNSKLSLPA